MFFIRQVVDQINLISKPQQLVFTNYFSAQPQYQIGS